jgi:hypothetical protein
MLSANLARVEVHNHVLNPAEAEIWITVLPVDPPGEAELRGRLVGPHCQYASTVEVAYPFRPLPGPPAKTGNLTARVIIPEPSFWDPESPLLYHGSLEGWKAGSRCWTAEISHGLRVLQLGKSGLRCNGRPLTVRGVSRKQLSEEDALQLRAEEYNTLLSDVSPETTDLWDAADRFGFLVLGRLSATKAAFRLVECLKFHACCLGWLLPPEALELSALPGDLVRLQGGGDQLLGLELDRRPPDRLLQPFQFVFAKEGLLPPEAEVQRPVLLKAPLPSSLGEGRGRVAASPQILGWIAE